MGLRPVTDQIDDIICSLPSTPADHRDFGSVRSALAELRRAAEDLTTQNRDLAFARAQLELERRRYRDLFELAPEAYIITDEQTVIQEANAAAGDLLRVPSNELVGKPLLSFIARGHRHNFVERLMLMVREQREAATWEGAVHPRGSSPSPTAFRLAESRNTDGSVQALRWILADVAVRDRTEELLLEAHTRLRLILEQVPAVLWTTDAHHRFTSILGAGLATLNLRPNELVGMAIADYGLFFDQALPGAAHERALTGEASTYEATWQERSWQIAVEPLSDPVGTVRGAMGLAVDITERVETEAALRSALAREHEITEELVKAQELREILLQAVSHDVLGPIAAVLGFALTLKQRRDELDVATERELTDRIVTNARRLQRIASDLLDATKLSTMGDVLPEAGRTDLAEAVVSALEAIDPNGHPIEVNLVTTPVFADRRMVERIVDNLIGNAIKHTTQDCRISVTVRPSGDGGILMVEDEGPGIPDEDKPTVFALFGRGPTTAPGSGVGLYLVARFAELHGGRAWVADRPGGGASFTVFLPADGPPGGDAG